VSGLDAEVLVVGGGPAGAATAALLAQRGREVMLLEKASFPREKPCAEYLSPGVVDVLGRLGALDAVTAARPARPLGMRLCTPRASALISYPDTGGPRRALGIPRPLLDGALLDHARGCGAHVRERVRALGADVEGGRVVGVRALSAAGPELLRARVVVAADGLRSAIARSLGLEMLVRRPRRLGLVARYAGAHRLGDYGEMHVGPGLYCGLAPVGDGLVNVGLVGPLEVQPRGETIGQFFERRLRALPGVARALGAARRVTPVRGVGPLVRRVRRVAGPGYLLVGDAAGFLDPFTGEGVYRALRGAELATAAVERTLGRGAAEPRGYARARQAAFADKEYLCLLVQLFLAAPPAFEYVLARLTGRPHTAAILSGALGDYRPAAPTLRPAYLWALLRP